MEPDVQWAQTVVGPLAAPWSPRHSHCVVSCQGHLILLGGFDSRVGSLNDVWTSPDGKEWRNITQAARWSARDGHQALVMGGFIYLIGGADKYQDPMECLNDVWLSKDAGASWTLVTSPGDSESNHWIGRWQHGAAVHKGPSRNKSSSNNYTNDLTENSVQKNDSSMASVTLERQQQLVIIGGWGEHGYLSDVCKCRYKLTPASTTIICFNSSILFFRVQRRWKVLADSDGIGGLRCAGDARCRKSSGRSLRSWWLRWQGVPK